ncbi:hypothetical protein [Haloarchaeobius sp. TZWWS8]|uniref:hypothetical protein n=1 Tax=Haloarchaeobius sp. TZWWS8 TaxID=3446121 RepID=UPI003EBF4EF8
MALHSRAVLVVVLVLVAGCSATPFGDSNTETREPLSVDTRTSDATTKTAATWSRTDPPTTDDGFYHAFTFVAYEVEPAEIAREYVPPRSQLHFSQRTVADELFENGSTTAVSIHPVSADSDRAFDAFDDGAFVRENGTYYRVSAEIVGERTADGYQMHFEGPIPEDREDRYERAKREAVDWANLTTGDRALVEHAAPSDSRRSHAEVSKGFYWAPPAGTESGSLVDGDRHYVRHEGDLFQVERVRNRSVVRYQVRYELVKVASSGESFAESSLGNLVVPFDDSNSSESGADSLGEDGRRVLLDALTTGMVDWDGTSSTVPDGYREAARWIREQPGGSRSYVEYEGDIYLLEVREVVE